MLHEADLAYGNLIDAELVDVELERAQLSSLSLDNARIVRGSFAAAVMHIAKLPSAKIESTVFDGAQLQRSDMRGADFGREPGGADATTAGARFERCDLRETTWEGRDLSGASFIRCKLGAMTGRPAAIAGVTISEPDLSPAGDGSDIANAREVLALWAVTGAR